MGRKNTGVTPQVTVRHSVHTIGVSTAYIQHVVTTVLEKERVTGSVSVYCIGDTRMRRLNRLYRQKDRTTDVLSFGMQDGMPFPDVSGVQDREWGDIFISVPQIRRQARTHAVSYREEFVRMLVHGVLHLLGYDHETKRDAAIMLPYQEMFVRVCL